MSSSSSLKIKIKRWKKTNQNYLNANEDRFISKTLYVLKEDSKSTIFEKYKQAMKQFKKEDKLLIKVPLYKEAVKVGFRGSLASATEKRIKQVISKNNPELEIEFVEEPELEIDFVDEPKKYKLYLSFFTDPLSEEEVGMKRGQKNSIERKHYKTQDNKRFQLAKEDWQEIVETSKDIIEMYESGHMIQHYVDNVVNGEITDEWEKFFEDIGQIVGGEFNNRLDTIIEMVRYIRVDQIDHVNEFKELEEKEKKKLLKQKMKKMKKEKNYDSSACSSVYPWIKIDYDRKLAKDDVKLLFKPRIESEYLKENQKERACVFNILIEAYANGHARYQRKIKRKHIQELTYEYLMQLFDFDPEETDLGLSLDILIEKWFKPLRLALVVFDKFEGIICKYHPSDDGKNINKDLSPSCLYLLASNHHLERCNEQLKSLQQKVRTIDEMSNPLTVSEHFYIPQERTKIPHILLDHFYEIRNIAWDEIKGQKLDITVQKTSLSSVFSYLVETCKIMPQYDYKGHDIMSSLTFKVDQLNVTIRNPDSDNVLGKLEFKTDDNNEQYDTFQDLKFRMNASLMKLETLSQFNELDILRQCAAKAVKYGIRSDLSTTHYVDKIKAYTECLLKIDKLAVPNKFDLFYDFSVFKDTYLRNEYFYLVQRTKTDGLSDKLKNVFLVQEFTIFRGYELKPKWNEIKNHAQIVGFYTVTNLVDNAPAKSMIRYIYESEILSEKQKKFIINMPTGMVEKSANKRKRCVLIEDEYEAEVLAMKYGATVSPFRYELAGDITDQEYVEYQDSLPPEERYVVDITEEDWYQQKKRQDRKDAEKAKKRRDIFSVELLRKKPLVDGFYFIKLQIYSIMRAMLTDMYEEVENMGGIPTAIHTDCIFYHFAHGDVKENLDIDGSKFENIGKYKWRKLGETAIPINLYVDPMDPMITPKLADKEHIYNIRERIKHLTKIPVTNFVPVVNEVLWKTDKKKYLEELISLIENGPQCVLIGALVPGAGKTFGASVYGKKQQTLNKKVLAVGPTHKRVKELSMMFGDGNAMTIYKVLKMRVKDGHAVDCDKVKVNPLDGVDVLIIDEIFALPVRMLGKIKSQIIDKYPNMKIIATGDPYQSRVNDVKVDDVDGYYKNAVATMFPYGLYLEINKRMATEKDIRQFDDISVALQKFQRIPHVQRITTVEEIIERHINSDGDFDGQILCYYRDTSKYVGNLIQHARMRHLSNQNKDWIIVEGMLLYEGQELLNKRWRKYQGKTLNVNDSLVVVEINDYVETVEEEDGTITQVSDVRIEMMDASGVLYRIKSSNLKNFAYPYCVTIHSSQGDTYSDCPVTLLDFDAYWILKNDKKVALSRANRIDNMRIYEGESLRVSEQKIEDIIEKRIKGHIIADTTSKRTFNMEEYVDDEWVLETLTKQKLTCAHSDCECELSLYDSEETTFSIDRKDNRFAHTKNNCVIACRQCNVSKKPL